MAHPIKGFAVVEVAKPNIGEKAPSRVRADVSVTLSLRDEIKHEWENLRKHDVCFLVTVRPTQGIGTYSSMTFYRYFGMVEKCSVKILAQTALISPYTNETPGPQLKP